jgi:hypothetical protein
MHWSSKEPITANYSTEKREGTLRFKPNASRQSLLVDDLATVVPTGGTRTQNPYFIMVVKPVRNTEPTPTQRCALEPQVVAESLGYVRAELKPSAPARSC